MESYNKNSTLLTTSLLVEIVFVIVASVSLIKVLSWKFSNETWFAMVVPFVLITAAIIPTILRKRKLNQIGFQIRNFRSLIIILSGTCLIIFPALICGVLILNHFAIPLPLLPKIPQNDWPTWIIYQFLYVAIPEEVFFRGYLQSNLTHLTSPIIHTSKKKDMAFGIILTSSLIFAVSHIIILGDIKSIITFFPGLIMGWLYYKTKSILAPVLFHSIANMSYAFIASVLS